MEFDYLGRTSKQIKQAGSSTAPLMKKLVYMSPCRLLAPNVNPQYPRFTANLKVRKQIWRKVYKLPFPSFASFLFHLQMMVELL